MESWPWVGGVDRLAIRSFVNPYQDNLASHQQHLIMMSMSPNLGYCEDSL